MIAEYVTVGIKQGVGGESGIGGLLVENHHGASVLSSIILHESNKYQSSNDPSTLIHLINFFAQLLNPYNEAIVSFVQSVMKLIPTKVLPELLNAFEHAAETQNKEGRLLLHIAAEKGLKWFDGHNRIFEKNRAAIV